MTSVVEQERVVEGGPDRVVSLSPVLVREVEESERAHGERLPPARQEAPRADRMPRPFSHD
jgi:hypothetical protein